MLLVGFSLGAITALDLALQQPPDALPAGVVFMNGAPIVVDEWAERVKERAALRVHSAPRPRRRTHGGARPCHPRLARAPAAPRLPSRPHTCVRGRPPPLRVAVTTGAKDMTLPEAACGWARDLLKASGVSPDYTVHPGGHEVGGPDILRGIAAFVARSIELAEGAQ